MQIAFPTPDDARWNEALIGVPHDAYHLAEYFHFAAAYHGGRAEASLLRAGDDRLFIPYLVRDIGQVPWLRTIAGDHVDLYTPYGYASPLCKGSGPFLAEAIAAWVDAMRQRGFVTGFIRLHPCCDFPREPLVEFGEIVHRGDTVAIDLRPSTAEMWSRVRHNHRRHINSATKAGLHVQEDQDFAHMDEFIAMYEATMRRASAAAFYYFPPGYYVDLKRWMGDRLKLFFVQNPRGERLAGGLFFACGGMLQYHLGGTHDHALDWRPSKLLLYHVGLWGRDAGYELLHLGGGLAARRDDLFQFKAGFSDLVTPFYTWHVIFDPDRYRALLQHRDSQMPSAEDPLFFPVYRAEAPALRPLVESTLPNGNGSGEERDAVTAC